MRTYTYRIPRTVNAVEGDLVWVPFGFRPLQGIVLRVSTDTDFDSPKAIDAVVQGGPYLATHQIELVHWVAEYYRTSLFKAAELLLPPGATSRLRVWVERTAKSYETDMTLDGMRLTEGQRAILAEVPVGRRLRRDKLAKSASSDRNRNIEALIRDGYLTTESVWEQPAGKPRVVKHIRIDSGVSVQDAVGRYARRRAQRRVGLVEMLAGSKDGAAKSDAKTEFGAAAVKAVIDDGVAIEFDVQIDRDPLSGYAAQEDIEHVLTSDQAHCVDVISDALNRRRLSPRFLLHGVTGSGKTEVYLRAVKSCLESGRRAIVMVPEIAMTPQMLQRFASRFPWRIALQHSGLSPGQRYDQWHKIKSGLYDIVLGSRSSIFAPVSGLGLVVIDEEHEWTFKQSDRAPRYHARDVAERLCEISDAVLLVGSATPDLSTYHRASSIGDESPYRLLLLPRRINEDVVRFVKASSGGEGDGPVLSERSEVSIVDMRKEFDAGHRELLSRELLGAMRENTELGRKTILFINRRGSAAFVQCTNCGAIRKCPNCNTSLTLHRVTRSGVKGLLRCHYCGYGVMVTRKCRVCGARGVNRRATGTEGAEEVVKAFFPETDVIRWDSDTARNSKEHSLILEQFQADGPRILVGTQMVAKGLDIPSVGLVGVLSADISLAIPSYRSPERTFQLIAQVVGRAGRYDVPGRAVIQTFLPDNPSILRGALQDYAGFYQSEIAVRRESALPPFVRHAMLGCSKFSQEEARLEADSVVTRLRDWVTGSGADTVTIVGPSPAFPFKRAGKFRYHVFLAMDDRPGASFNPVLDAVPLGPSWTVEIDPLGMN